jgi:hypothetical protein
MDMMDVQPSAKAGWFKRFCIRIVGADEERLLHFCPQRDQEIVLALALLMLTVWLYQTSLFAIVAHRLFAAPGQIRPELIVASAFIGAIVLQFDGFAMMRTGWILDGIKLLRKGGIDISGGIGERVKFGVFLCIRILLSIGIAQLTAIFLSLLIFGSDITARLQQANLNANAAVTSSSTALVDGEIQRARDAVNAESTQEVALATQVTALRQVQVDPSAGDAQVQLAQQVVAQLLAQKTAADQAVQQSETIASAELGGIKSPETSGIPGDGPRRQAALEAAENAKDQDQQIGAALAAAQTRLDALHSQSLSRSQTTEQQSHAELPAFQNMLAVEDTKLAAMKNALAALEDHRDDAIRTAVEAAPGYVPYNNGLLAQITALDQIAHGNRKIEAVIILVDMTSFGFELAAVLAKVTSYVPTTYAALLARDSYMQVVRLVDEMMTELNASSGKPSRESEIIPPIVPPYATRRNAARPSPETDPFSNPLGPLSATPKRRRGRPRKTPPII